MSLFSKSVSSAPILDLVAPLIESGDRTQIALKYLQPLRDCILVCPDLALPTALTFKYLAQDPVYPEIVARELLEVSFYAGLDHPERQEIFQIMRDHVVALGDTNPCAVEKLARWSFIYAPWETTRESAEAATKVLALAQSYAAKCNPMSRTEEEVFEQRLNKARTDFNTLPAAVKHYIPFNSAKARDDVVVGIEQAIARRKFPKPPTREQARDFVERMVIRFSQS